MAEFNLDTGFVPVVSEENVQAGEVVFEKPGDSFTGVYDRSAPGQFGDVYFFIDQNSDRRIVFGSTVLATKLKGVQPGQTVQIKYVGTQKSGTGRDYKNFLVGIKQ